MPLLLCPNCNTSMTAVNRQGVEFDMCPACRGVWLDRGELEKLVAGASEGQARASVPPPSPEASYRPAPPQRPYRDDDDDDDYRRHGSPKGRKKRFDLFDIFD